MNKKDPQENYVDPMSQLCLYNYENYFESLIKLHNGNRLPKIMLFSGEKGIGKTTLLFHFINYLLSKNEKHSYSLDNFKINHENKSFNLVYNNLHPNFYLIQNSTKKKNIEINQIRNLFNFLNKTTYLNDIKIVLIIDTENLNKNSSNALLKSLEEPSNNTFFFLVHDSNAHLLETIKSRCYEFKIFHNTDSKKEIMSKLINQFDLPISNLSSLEDKYKYLTPGILLNYVKLKSIYKIEKNDIYSELVSFIDVYLKEKNEMVLKVISFLNEYLHHQLYLNNPTNLTFYYNKNKVANNIFLMKKYNLDERNILSEVKNIVENEKK